MIGIALRFELGRYHATPWGTHVNDAAVEWPPSPWRVLRALYAVARTNVQLHAEREALDAALVHLAGAPDPLYELPASVAAHTRHYFPSRIYSAAKPGEKDLVIDAFRAVEPSEPVVVWWRVELDPPERRALAKAAAALPYLGRSESVCAAELLAEGEPGEVDAAPLDEGIVPAEGSDVAELLSLAPGLRDPLGALSASVTSLRRARRLIPEGASRVTYRVKAAEPSLSARLPADERPELATFRLVGRGRPGIRDAVAVGHHMRAAAQSTFGRVVGGTSPVFSGHTVTGPRSDQHRHAHYLSTPGADGRRIEHVHVWAPEGLGPAEVQALDALERLVMRGLPEPLRLILVSLGNPSQLELPTVVGPSRNWRTSTPFGLVRHPKRRGGGIVDAPESQIRTELARRGVPAPVPGEEGVRLVRGPWLEFRRSRPGTTRLQAPRVVGAELTFSQPTTGPIALGTLSHFGLGLFVPNG